MFCGGPGRPLSWDFDAPYKSRCLTQRLVEPRQRFVTSSQPMNSATGTEKIDLTEEQSNLGSGIGCRDRHPRFRSQ